MRIIDNKYYFVNYEKLLNDIVVKQKALKEIDHLNQNDRLYNVGLGKSFVGGIYGNLKRSEQLTDIYEKKYEQVKKPGVCNKMAFEKLCMLFGLKMQDYILKEKKDFEVVKKPAPIPTTSIIDVKKFCFVDCTPLKKDLQAAQKKLLAKDGIKQTDRLSAAGLGNNVPANIEGTLVRSKTLMAEYKNNYISVEHPGVINSVVYGKLCKLYGLDFRAYLLNPVSDTIKDPEEPKPELTDIQRLESKIDDIYKTLVEINKNLTYFRDESVRWGGIRVKER